MIEFDYAIATDTPGDPNRKILMMIATDSIHGSIFAFVARRKGGQDDYVIRSFQNFFDRLGLVKAQLKCDQEQSTLDWANALVRRCQFHESCCDCDAKKARKGAWGVENEQI